MVKILVKKFDKNIKLPAYKTSGSSGMDLVAHTKSKINIKPGKIAIIPTGIAVANRLALILAGQLLRGYRVEY